MPFTAGFGDGLDQMIRRFDVAAREVDNVVSAALQDVGNAIVDTLAVDWPIGERRYPSQAGPHSADLWRLEELGPLSFAIANDAPYIRFVHGHPNQGGPPGLLDRVLPGLIEQAEAQPLALMSDRVLALLVA